MSDLVGNPEYRFSHNEAHLTNVLTGFDSGTGVRDDDEPYEYGSVVYIYNENTVRLFAPNMVNGYASGYVIYTGKNQWKQQELLSI